MDYFGILERSFVITRRYRALWLFGFLLALFSAGGGAGNGVQYTFQGDEAPLNQIGAPPGLGVLVILIVVVLVVALAILAAVIKYVCQTALIDLVAEIETGKDPTVRHGFDIGWSRSSLRLFGVDIALVVPVLVILIILGLLFAVPFFVFSAGDQGGPGPLIFVLLCCLVFLVPLLIAVVVALDLFEKFAFRQVVLAGDGVLAGIRRSYRLVRANLGQIAAMWLIMFIIGLLWAAVNLIVGLVAVAAVGGPAALMYAIFRSGLAAALTALPFLLVTILVFAVINALYTVFTSTVWTLTYLELPNRPASRGTLITKEMLDHE